MMADEIKMRQERLTGTKLLSEHFPRVPSLELVPLGDGYSLALTPTWDA
jgi:hypothetical protein